MYNFVKTIEFFSQNKPETVISYSFHETVRIRRIRNSKKFLGFSFAQKFWRKKWHGKFYSMIQASCHFRPESGILQVWRQSHRCIRFLILGFCAVFCLDNFLFLFFRLFLLCFWTCRSVRLFRSSMSAQPIVAGNVEPGTFGQTTKIQTNAFGICITEETKVYLYDVDISFQSRSGKIVQITRKGKDEYVSIPSFCTFLVTL